MRVGPRQTDPPSLTVPRAPYSPAPANSDTVELELGRGTRHCPLARPNQLVVVVAVRTGRPALVVRVKGDVVEKQNLQRGAGLRQAIDDDFAERRFCCLGSDFESEPL